MGQERSENVRKKVVRKTFHIGKCMHYYDFRNGKLRCLRCGAAPSSDRKASKSRFLKDL